MANQGALRLGFRASLRPCPGAVLGECKILKTAFRTLSLKPARGSEMVVKKPGFHLQCRLALRPYRDSALQGDRISRAGEYAVFRASVLTGPERGGLWVSGQSARSAKAQRPRSCRLRAGSAVRVPVQSFDAAAGHARRLAWLWPRRCARKA